MSELSEMRQEFESRFEKIYGLLEKIIAKLEEHDRRFDSIERRLDALENRMDALEKRMDTLEKRMDSIEIIYTKLRYKLQILNESIQELRTDFHMFERRLNQLEEGSA